MANCDCNTSAHAAPKSANPATLEDSDEALSEAQMAVRIIGALADASLMDNGENNAGIYGWLADRLEHQLERIEVASNTLRRAGS